MNPYLQRLLAIGIPVGIFMTIIYSLEYGIFSGIAYGVLIGTTFGGLMSLLFGFLAQRSLIWKLRSKSQASRGVHHVRQVEIKLPYDAAYNLCRESLQFIQDCQVQHEEWARGRIVARAGVGWQNRGNMISLEVYNLDFNKVRIRVSSRPVLSTDLIDYGRNLENVERITRFLKLRTSY